MKRYPTVLLLLVSLVAVAQDRLLVGEVEITIELLQNALNESKYDLLEPRLAPSFSYGDIGGGSRGDLSLKLLENLVGDYHRIHEIERIEVAQITPQDSHFSVLARFHYSEKKKHNVEEQEILVDSTGRILRLEIPLITITLGE